MQKIRQTTKDGLDCLILPLPDHKNLEIQSLKAHFEIKVDNKQIKQIFYSTDPKYPNNEHLCLHIVTKLGTAHFWSENGSIEITYNREPQYDGECVDDDYSAKPIDYLYIKDVESQTQLHFTNEHNLIEYLYIS